jgi:hypothetical protein
MKAETDSLLDRDEQTKHELNLSFLKKRALEDEYEQNSLVDCTRISQASARRFVPSRAIGQFPERMSQVASTALLPSAAKPLAPKTFANCCRQ